ncbi:MAG: hypothetical protein L0I94_07815 [Yaniella sp.]|uniref:maltokinase N-terminal cap-like domain-containing protein n=1 Tax=Yaniella sp. TaxID=2773929 RepID=UPI0026473DE0|nr:hypothetical protein [Yaniella sp.]MDN5730637.1 hypothetical protein [Yaniella sp.]MDN5818232.1 hypothetical protein [Yaniella sp.]MDN5889225.1 hypothetical protein [Yaniella sp.]MDN5911491.1 hypothetical protein [Yaniella sp.]MDN6148728.1 hypothetical protein [Yaniella sp.]
MATVYVVETNPTKKEFVTAWLDKQFWGGSGDPELIGTYRFDDTGGEVGFEGFILKREDKILHLPMTYRAAPLEGADDYLIVKMDHPVLGDRWAYDAMADPVGIHMLNQALAGEIQQADFHFYNQDGQYQGTEDSDISIYIRGELPEAWGTVSVHHVLDHLDLDGGELRRLVGRWEDASATLFELTPTQAAPTDTQPIISE